MANRDSPAVNENLNGNANQNQNQHPSQAQDEGQDDNQGQNPPLINLCNPPPPHNPFYLMLP